MHQPLITVIIPVYNAAQYLAEAIQSVLSQSHTNLEIKILDDGSEDNSVAIAKSFKDNRIEVLESTENHGPAYRLNQGVATATGEYISIMHADDIMHQKKLEKQLRYFKNNPAVSVCGCNVQLVDEPSAIWTYPENDQACKDHLLSTVPFAHPAVVFKTAAVQQHQPLYNENMVAAEDYDLWVRLAAGIVGFGNSPEVLLSYRIHPQQISNRKKEEEKKLIEIVQQQVITRLFKVQTETEVNACFNLLYKPAGSLPGEALNAIAILWASNERHKIFSRRGLAQRLRYSLYISLSKLSLPQRIKYIFSRSAIFETAFFKTVLRSLIFPNVQSKF